MESLSGKVAIVTGASRGIGRATAKRLARAGADVYLAADGPAAELEAAAADCIAANAAARARWGVFDLANKEAPARMVQAALDAFGRIDILVNNAGIRIRHPFGDYSPEEFDRMVAVNVRPAFLASQAVLPAMRSQGGGRIVHVASQIGLVAYKESLLYGMTKAALIYLARAMAYELARENIVVNAVSPGPIMTEYNVERVKQNPAFYGERVAYVPAARYGEPHEVAEAIFFLASGAPSYVQGHNLVIDGGYICH